MLPKNLAYGSKVESASARSYRTNIQPQNGTGNYSAGETIIINIPTRNNLVYVPSESYLKFQHTVTASATSKYTRFDACGAHGLIQRIRVFHGSNLLSDIDNYGLLSKLLFDLQVPTDSTYGKYNILAGTRSDLVVSIPATTGADFTGAGATKFSGITFPVNQINGGVRMNTSGTHAANAAGKQSQTFCLNLITLAGSLCKDKYFPLFACTSAPLRVEIQLVSSCQAGMCIEQDSTFVIDKCEYIAQMIELSDSAMNIIRESQNGQPLQFVNPDYRNYQYTFALAATPAITQLTMPIPAKFSSLKSLFITVRDTAKASVLTYFPYSSNKFGITQYFFRVGAQVMPSKVPDTLPEMFSECVKAIGSMGDLNHQPSIDWASYSQDVAPANANDEVNTLGTPTYQVSSTSSGSFYVGLDLENYSNADKAAIFSGWNSNTDDIYFIPSFVAPAAITARFDAFALFDTVVVFENGTCYVKY
jgi:hypothetical protein